SSARMSCRPPSRLWLNRPTSRQEVSNTNRCSALPSTSRSPCTETPFAPRTPPRGFGSSARQMLSGTGVTKETLPSERSRTSSRALTPPSGAPRPHVVTTTRRRPPSRSSGRMVPIRAVTARLDEIQDRLGPDGDVLLDHAFVVDQVADRGGEHPVEL